MKAKEHRFTHDLSLYLNSNWKYLRPFLTLSTINSNHFFSKHICRCSLPMFCTSGWLVLALQLCQKAMHSSESHVNFSSSCNTGKQHVANWNSVHGQLFLFKIPMKKLIKNSSQYPFSIYVPVKQGFSTCICDPNIKAAEKNKTMKIKR